MTWAFCIAHVPSDLADDVRAISADEFAKINEAYAVLFALGGSARRGEPWFEALVSFGAASEKKIT